MFYQDPPYMASRQLLIPRIAAVGTSFSPLPCQAWHGYGVTSAHCVEVEVGADGLANAPPSGAAAAAPPAGALVDTTHDYDRPTRVRGAPDRFGNYVAHVSIVPRVCVTHASSPDLSDHMKDVALHDLSMMVAHPRHKSTKGPIADVTLV
jgi:hypothetical protein